jgi:hypothetical protein
MARFCCSCSRLLLLAVALCLMSSTQAADWKWKKGRATYYGGCLRLLLSTRATSVHELCSSLTTRTVRLKFPAAQALMTGPSTRAPAAMVPSGGMSPMGILVLLTLVVHRCVSSSSGCAERASVLPVLGCADHDCLGLWCRWDVAAITDFHPDYTNACGTCYELACDSTWIQDNYGDKFDRTYSCYDTSKVRCAQAPPTLLHLAFTADSLSTLSHTDQAVCAAFTCALPQSVVVRITDTCPCTYPANAYSNKVSCGLALASVLACLSGRRTHIPLNILVVRAAHAVIAAKGANQDCCCCVPCCSAGAAMIKTILMCLCGLGRSSQTRSGV